MATDTQTDSRTRGPGRFLGGLSLRELAQRIVHEVQQDNCAGQAAQLAYYLIFAAFPFLLFLTTLLGYVPVPNLMDSIMRYLATLLPGEALDLLREHVRQLVTDQKGGLLSFAIIAAIWTASSAVAAIIDALNRAYKVQEGRPFWKSSSCFSRWRWRSCTILLRMWSRSGNGLPPALPLQCCSAHDHCGLLKFFLLCEQFWVVQQNL